MYRFLFTRQWVSLTLLGLVLIPTMIKLGFWQLHRHESRVAHNQLVTRSLAAADVPVDRISGVHHDPRTSDEYRSVTARGRYDAAHQFVVRQRTNSDGQTIGYFLVTPLIRHDGKAVLINRGWIPANGDLTKFPKVPSTPRGTVTVTGRIMPDETTAASGIKDKPGLPPRQTMLINSQQQTKTLHRPVLDGYVQLLKTSPAPQHGKQPQQLQPPDHSSIGPHMAYTIQWWLFAAAVPYGWIVLVRRERADRLAAAAGEAGTDTGGGNDEDGPGGSAKPDEAEGAEGPEDTQGPEDPEQTEPSGASEAPATAAGSRPSR